MFQAVIYFDSTDIGFLNFVLTPSVEAEIP
jgi:hypothetical protein